MARETDLDRDTAAPVASRFYAVFARGRAWAGAPWTSALTPILDCDPGVTTRVAEIVRIRALMRPRTRCKAADRPQDCVKSSPGSR